MPTSASAGTPSSSAAPGGVPVAVLGSANADLVVTVGRAPGAGETVSGHGFTTTVGGKGLNQAVAAARAGARVRMVATVGDDVHGRLLRDTLAREGVDTDALRVHPGLPTGTAHITVEDDGENRIVVVPGANAATGAHPDDLRALRDRPPRVLLLQLEIPVPAVVAAARAVAPSGTRVVLTPAPVPRGGLPGDLLGQVDLLVPNQHEACALAGTGDLAEAVRWLLRRVPEVVVTLGARGCLHATRDGGHTVVPAVPVTAVDTTGAGDVFAGVLAVALAEGSPVDGALRRATAAAALSVTRSGAAASAPRRDEIDRAVRPAAPAGRAARG
ncbi:ribokinase [Allostreptomyces psammosilenae]|uniref:Ribokinase n=1 Tax=Allostreptomyces psammosilenae TaxID=1892865 RepID=A0A852ZP14_9ACTN|nr:ribokinase [Allostreptomyces psammosilenae]NYI04119.1 ribokinase [Allostreptomyces psammosilenae]